MTDNTKIGALEGHHSTFERPNCRNETAFLGVSALYGFAPWADLGPWRKDNGLTDHVGPLVLRLFGEFASNRTGIRPMDPLAETINGTDTPLSVDP